MLHNQCEVEWAPSLIMRQEEDGTPHACKVILTNTMQGKPYCAPNIRRSH